MTNKTAGLKRDAYTIIENGFETNTIKKNLIVYNVAKAIAAEAQMKAALTAVDTRRKAEADTNLARARELDALETRLFKNVSATAVLHWIKTDTKSALVQTIAAENIFDRNWDYYTRAYRAQQLKKAGDADEVYINETAQYEYAAKHALDTTSVTIINEISATIAAQNKETEEYAQQSTADIELARNARLSTAAQNE